jgi:hypothetical protein
MFNDVVARRVGDVRLALDRCEAGPGHVAALAVRERVRERLVEWSSVRVARPRAAPEPRDRPLGLLALPLHRRERGEGAHPPASARRVGTATPAKSSSPSS